MERKVAFVSGASRGIGKAAALELANKGFDVVVAARTIEEGKTADGRPLPGSITTTAEEIRALGRDALPIYMDLQERSSVRAAFDQTMAEWGRIDVLDNNGLYTGPGNMQRFLEIDIDEVEKLFQANLFSQLYLLRMVLPHMLERGSGTVINMVSGAGMGDPPAPAREGGWGYAYGASKGAFLRVAGALHVEHTGSGLRFFSLEPGFVLTEAMALNDPDGELSKFVKGAPMSVPASVIAWLATAPEAEELNGQAVFAQPFALERGLHPEW